MTTSPENTPPQGVDDNEFSLVDLYHPRSRYTAEQKLSAVMAYVVTGNSKQSAKISGIPAPTIRWWKSAAHWWPDAIAKCRKQKNDELDAKITEIQDKALEKLAGALEAGEEVATKDGDIVRKEVSARDLSVIFGTIFDKRNLIRGEPTNVSQRQDQSEILESLKNKFEELSNEIKKKENKKIVSEQ